MAAIICLDFDDTVVLDNTARQLFERFAPPRWRDFEARYRNGEMSVEQYNAAALDLVEATAGDLREFARSVGRPRPGLLELTDWAHWNGWLTVVVSNGFDLYVDPILNGLGLDRVARHTGRARFLYRWRVTYLSPRGVELQEGFKLSYASAFRQSGDFVVYAGDGASDVQAACLAPAVFARHTLWDRLKDSHPRIYPFETFHDTIAVLDREAQSWLESFSSTTAAAD